MVTGVFRVLASGVLLLPLDTTTTTLALRADAFSTATSDDFALCETEHAACFSSAVCTSFFTADDVARTEPGTCGAALDLDGASTSTLPCDELMGGPFCQEVVSGNACLDNDEAVDYWMCFLEWKGCYVDEISCDDVEDAVAASNGATTTGARPGDAWIVATAGFSFTFMLLLPFLRS